MSESASRRPPAPRRREPAGSAHPPPGSHPADAAPAQEASGAPELASLKYLAGYPEPLLAQVSTLISQNKLGALIARRYPEGHTVRTDRALWDYVQALKTNHLRSSEPLAKVQYDPQIRLLQHALGTHRLVSRVQGGRLKAKREIRIASLFREAPAAFLRMIAVHELAHLRHQDHDKAFYQLCCYMEPEYHQLEFDLRLYLTHLELQGRLAG
ncbi:YgjP-like metallopeptidase domain-containing protein [Azohydromonas lata]|uniref:YgjP-like metallopeptidase domain-containing protein n=1 Tax=Azohydromonas lata TaxID=45677 RepID=UPI000A04781B|nr:YgjP-like metallopeptidase domain-containing protein [Azohydromonas lata]